MADSEYRTFVQSVIDNIKKNGFPEKKVAFPIEQLYDAAHKKGINFNKVLETLDSIQIAHSKTPEKVIFFAKDKAPIAEPSSDQAPPDTPFAGLNPGMFANLDPSALGDMDASSLMQMAAGMMKNMTPEQLDSIKAMYENMSDEEREAMMEQAKKLGLF